VYKDEEEPNDDDASGDDAAESDTEATQTVEASAEDKVGEVKTAPEAEDMQAEEATWGRRNLFRRETPKHIYYWPPESALQDKYIQKLHRYFEYLSIWAPSIQVLA
jgi:hypothetical protein